VRFTSLVPLDDKYFPTVVIFQEELVTKEELKDLDKKIKAKVDEAFAKAQEEEFPHENELFTNIYKADSGLVAYGCDRRHTKVQMP
jgi:hypothetical protein